MAQNLSGGPNLPQTGISRPRLGLPLGWMCKRLGSGPTSGWKVGPVASFQRGQAIPIDRGGCHLEKLGWRYLDRWNVWELESGRGTHLEGESTGEPACTAAGLTSKWIATSRREATTSAVHHVEQNVGINVDMSAVHSTHAAHSTHTAHTTHAAEAATAEHISRVDKIVAVVVCGTLSKEGKEMRSAKVILSLRVERCGGIWGHTEGRSRFRKPRQSP